MDLVYGTELTFGDGFAVEYWHRFGIQSNGPLNTNILETEPSGGIATFPDIKNFSDRIFIWRAMGNKLYIEERSTLYSLTDNSICMDVGRSYIIPGTSITFFKQGVLSIVVPTATSVHRFYKAITSKPDNTGSLLHRLFEDEGFSIYETKFELRTKGRPIRASVTHHPNKNTVSYITAEGELRFVALGRDQENENVGHEEFRLPELGFYYKWFGRTSRLVSDSCAMRDLSEVSSDKKSGPKSDIIFAVTRDGIVEAWNADNKEQLETRINLNEYLSPDDPIPRRTDDSKRSDTDDSTSTEAGPTRLEYTMKAYPYGSDILIIVGCDVVIGRQSVGIRVHIIKFSNYEMKHLQMYEKRVTDNSMSLVDLGLLQTYFPPKESEELVEKEQKCEEKNARTAAQFSLSALFKSSSTQKSYSIQRISFAIQWDTGEVISDLDWHPVRPFLPVPTSDGRNDGDEQKKPFFLIPDASYEQINDVVFNFDLFPFDIVHRGIQIVSDNWDVSETPDGTQRYFKDISDGEWNVLYNFVQSYLRSPEYKQKFNKPSPELKSMSSKQKHQALYQDFWWKYLEVCQQLDFNARGVISLSPIQISGNLRIMAVIHRDRMTILEEVNTELLNLLMMKNKEKLKLEPKFPKELDNEMTALIEEASLLADRRVFLMNRHRARVMCSVAGSVPMEDDVKVNPFDFDTDGRFLQITTVQYARIVALTKAFLAAAAYDPTKPYGGMITRDFNGSFTQGLVAVNIRRTVESRVHFALILLSLYNSIKAQNERDGVEPFKIIHSLSRKLKEIIRIYWELKEILDVKITRGGLKLNIETWIVSDDEALGILKREGGYGPNGYKEIRLKDFNWFVKVTTEAAVRAFLSTTEILLVPRLLAERNEYRVLLSLFVQKYVQKTEALEPVFEFYQGIAWSGLGLGQRTQSSAEVLGSSWNPPPVVTPSLTLLLVDLSSASSYGLLGILFSSSGLLLLLRILGSSCSPSLILGSSCSPSVILGSSCSPPQILSSSCSPHQILGSSCSPHQILGSSGSPHLGFFRTPPHQVLGSSGSPHLGFFRTPPHQVLGSSGSPHLGFFRTPPHQVLGSSGSPHLGFFRTPPHQVLGSSGSPHLGFFRTPPQVPVLLMFTTEHLALGIFAHERPMFESGNRALRKTTLHFLQKRFNAPRGIDPINAMTIAEYYLTIMGIFQEHNQTEQVAFAASTAIKKLSMNNDSVRIMANTLYNHLTKTHQWHEAFLLATKMNKNLETLRAAIREQLKLMLEAGHWEVIAKTKYGVHEKTVEDFLREEAENQPRAADPHYYELLYAFFMARKEFRQAACVMCEYSRYMESAEVMTLELATKRLHCMSVATNLLEVIGMEPDSGNYEPTYDDHTYTDIIIIPVPPEKSSVGPDDTERTPLVPQRIKRQESQSTEGSSSGSSGSSGSSTLTPGSGKTTDSEGSSSSSSGNSMEAAAMRARQRIPFAKSDSEETNTDSGDEMIGRFPLSQRRQIVVLTEQDIRFIWTQCLSTTRLLACEEFNGIPPDDPEELLPLLIEHKLFDNAFDIVRIFNMDSQNLFNVITREAIEIDALRNHLYEKVYYTKENPLTKWVRENRRHYAPFPKIEDHWAVVRGLVEAAQDEYPADPKPLRGATEAFLTYHLTIPSWLHVTYKIVNPNDYLRCLADYGQYAAALQLIAEVVEQETPKLSQPNARAWLPYGVIDELMKKSAEYVVRMREKTPIDQALAQKVDDLRALADQKMVIYFQTLSDFEQAHRI